MKLVLFVFCIFPFGGCDEGQLHCKGSSLCFVCSEYILHTLLKGGMYLVVHPDDRDISLGMYQEIHHYRSIRIDNVEINTFLVMVRECKICLNKTLGFLITPPGSNPQAAVYVSSLLCSELHLMGDCNVMPCLCTYMCLVLLVKGYCSIWSGDKLLRKHDFSSEKNYCGALGSWNSATFGSAGLDPMY